jgi:hypothetical protein
MAAAAATRAYPREVVPVNWKIAPALPMPPA